MKNHRIASVDIGTNTLLMTIADVSENGMEVIDDIHSIARLGQNVDSSKTIQPDAIKRAVDILHRYKARITELGVDKIRAVGTSCLRDADNREEVCKELEAALGNPIEVITGDEEARLCFIGTVENDEPTTVLDIGGGSTEIISGKGNTISFRTSLDIGAVRLTEKYFRNLPPTTSQVQTAFDEVRESIYTIDKELFYPLRVVAGTPTTLAAVCLGIDTFDASKIHNYPLSTLSVHILLRQLVDSTFDELTAMTGVHPGRADILPAGTLILHEFLRYTDQLKCMVSVKGLRYGVLKEMAAGL
ncbi:MAG: Ppx/GppA family phosphatase [Ignavibacteriae bacterium]|nr:Ppx/GppA family phosphatase [Ignavibacteriota bacterium]